MVCYFTIPSVYFLFFLSLTLCICTGLVSSDKISLVVTRFYLSPHSPPTVEVVLTRSGSFDLTFLLAINQALPYGCSFITYGHPGGSAADDITIIWNDVLK